jgi:hypothetical protein
MFFYYLVIGVLSACFCYEYLTKLGIGLGSLFLKAFIDLFKGVSKIQVVDGWSELKPDEIWILQAVVGLEKGPRVNMVGEEYLKVALNGL